MIYLLFQEEEGLIIQKDQTSWWQLWWVLWSKSESEQSGNCWCYTHWNSKEVRGSQIQKWSWWFQLQKGRQVILRLSWWGPTWAFFKVKTTCSTSWRFQLQKGPQVASRLSWWGFNWAFLQIKTIYTASNESGVWRFIIIKQIKQWQWVLRWGEGSLKGKDKRTSTTSSSQEETQVLISTLFPG